MLGILAMFLVAAMQIELGADDPDESEPDDATSPRAQPVPPPGDATFSPAPDPLEELETTVALEDWERLADCESGDWTADGEPTPGSARWDYGLEFDHGDHFQGGLNFHPDTWDAFRDADMPGHAGRASQAEEIEVAERVLQEQGWDAWPVCSEMLNLAE